MSSPNRAKQSMEDVFKAWDTLRSAIGTVQVSQPHQISEAVIDLGYAQRDMDRAIQAMVDDLIGVDKAE